jgi:hypothetical protein
MSVTTTLAVLFTIPPVGAAPATPTLRVDPAELLVDNQRVVVTGTNARLGSVQVTQCPVQPTGPICRDGHPYAVTFLASSNLRVVMRLRRFLSLPPSPIASRDVDCSVAGACVVALRFGVDSRPSATTAVRFDPYVPAGPQPTAVVSPSSNLRDHQRVTVRGTGFPPVTDVWVSECASVPLPLPPGQYCYGGPTTGVRSDGVGNITVTMDVARIMPLPLGGVDCASSGACSLRTRALRDWTLQAPDTAIAFDPSVPQPPPPPTIALAPHAALADRQAATVTGNGFAPGAPVLIRQCPSEVTFIYDDRCSGSPRIDAVADDSGSFSTLIAPRRLVRPSFGPTVDCALVPSRCVLLAASFEQQSHPARAAVGFDPNAPAPPTPTISVSPSRDLAARPRVTVVGHNFGPGDTVYLEQCSVAPVCGGLGAQAKADATGGFVKEVVLGRLMTDRAGNGNPPVDCAFFAQGCSVIAGGSEATAITSVHFDPAVPLPPPPRLAIAPSSNLADGQRVIALASGLGPEHFVTIRQCVAALPASTGCDPETNADGVSDASGSFGTEIVAVRHVFTDSQVTDCAVRAGACVLRLFSEDGTAEAALPLQLLPVVRTSPASVVEGDGGATVARLTVRLSRPSLRSVGVAFRTNDFTAKAPGDYTTRNGSLVFAPGQTSKTIDVAVVGDNTAEATEQFLIYFSRLVNARSVDFAPKAVVTVIDDD